MWLRRHGFNIPMQVPKVGSIASVGMESMHVRGSVSALIPGGSAGISIICTEYT